MRYKLYHGRHKASLNNGEKKRPKIKIRPSSRIKTLAELQEYSEELTVIGFIFAHAQCDLIVRLNDGYFHIFVKFRV